MMVAGRSIRLGVAAATLLLLVLACRFGAGGSETTATVPTMPPGPTKTPVSFMPEPTEVPIEDPGQCEPPTPQINIGEPVDGQVATAEDPPQERVFYCVMIPQETGRAIFELSGTTAALNLFVGHPDLATVQDGGVLFWSDMSGGPGDKQVVAEMGVRDFLFAGPYYIEVSPDDFGESSPFTLLVTIE